MTATAHHFQIDLADGKLPSQAQVRCHLRCLGRQLAHLHLTRIPFHLHGIARALRETM